MRTIAVLNQKGGVGKTTTVANLSAALAMGGQKVLVVDIDPQGHLTIHLGADRDRLNGGTYSVLTQKIRVEDAATKIRENLWLLGADINLVGAESELVSVVGREIILREAMESVKDRFDYLIIDCPPSLGLLTLNALVAVSEVFIPLQPHFLALEGLGKLMEIVKLVSRRINPDLKITGILLCMFDRRVTLSSEVKADIESFLEAAKGVGSPWSDARIMPVHIRRNIKLAEAPSYGKTIFEYEPDCNGSRDYMAVADYVRDCMGSNARPWPLVEPEDKPVNLTGDASAGKPADKPTGKPEDQSIDKTEDRLADKPESKTKDKLEDRLEDKSTDQLEDKAQNKPVVQKKVARLLIRSVRSQRSRNRMLQQAGRTAVMTGHICSAGSVRLRQKIK